MGLSIGDLVRTAYTVSLTGKRVIFYNGSIAPGTATGSCRRAREAAPRAKRSARVPTSANCRVLWGRCYIAVWQIGYATPIMLAVCAECGFRVDRPTMQRPANAVAARAESRIAGMLRSPE
jgi:hypothetical protein